MRVGKYGKGKGRVPVDEFFDVGVVDFGGDGVVGVRSSGRGRVVAVETEVRGEVVSQKELNKNSGSGAATSDM